MGEYLSHTLTAIGAGGSVAQPLLLSTRRLRLVPRSGFRAARIHTAAMREPFGATHCYVYQKQSVCKVRVAQIASPADPRNVLDGKGV